MTNKAKILATLIAAGLCGWLMYLTQGAHGIGWFIIALMFIWSNGV